MLTADQVNAVWMQDMHVAGCQFCDAPRKAICKITCSVHRPAKRTCDAQHYTSQRLPSFVSIPQQVIEPVVGAKSSKNAWPMGMDVVDANHGIAQQPQQYDWGEGYANKSGAKSLDQEK